MTTDEHLILEDVTARRGGRAVLSSFSLRLHERLVGLVGANGSGKSTLLRLAHGLMLPDAGTVRTLGLDTRTDQRTIPSRVGFLFQSPDRQIIFPTVGEEVAFSFEVDQMPRKEALRAAQACLARFGRPHWADRPIGDLSEGERQLACLIAVMAREPGLLLLDEPFASLDLATRHAFSRRLDGLGIPLVMASHDLDFLAGFDRVVWLEDGRIAADGGPAEILPAFRESMKAHAHTMTGSDP
jgi:biotin transport system ATP-binding protein